MTTPVGLVRVEAGGEAAAAAVVQVGHRGVGDGRAEDQVDGTPLADAVADDAGAGHAVGVGGRVQGGAAGRTRTAGGWWPHRRRRRRPGRGGPCGTGRGWGSAAGVVGVGGDQPGRVDVQVGRGPQPADAQLDPQKRPVEQAVAMGGGVDEAHAQVGVQLRAGVVAGRLEGGLAEADGGLLEVVVGPLGGGGGVGGHGRERRPVAGVDGDLLLERRVGGGDPVDQYRLDPGGGGGGQEPPHRPGRRHVGDERQRVPGAGQFQGLPAQLDVDAEGFLQVAGGADADGQGLDQVGDGRAKALEDAPALDRERGRGVHGIDGVGRFAVERVQINRGGEKAHGRVTGKSLRGRPGGGKVAGHP